MCCLEDAVRVPRCVGSVTLPQALAQSLQCPLLDPEAPPRRALTVRTVPDPPSGGGDVASAQHGQPPAMNQAAQPSAQPSAATAASAAESETTSMSVGDQTAPPLRERDPVHSMQQQPVQQQVTSFMVSGQRRVAKRPRVREHRR